ncbi:MAG TPA: hypothetical protein VHR17_07420 [Thermoanaerobaculia bacterium]|nr:hypothetical protein [Thermoanaerobaculia bacterium]
MAPLEPLTSLLLDAAAIAPVPTTARMYAELALELDPTSADAYDTLGNLATDLDPATAAAEYATALQLDPHAARVHYNLAVLLQTRGEPSAAEAQYRAALALQPTLLAAIKNLGVLLAAQPNRLDEARAFDARYPAWRARSAAARNVRMAGNPAAAKSRSNRGSSPKRPEHRKGIECDVSQVLMDGRRALLARPLEPGQRILDVARLDVGKRQLEGRHA